MVNAESGGLVLKKNHADAIALITQLAERSRDFERKPSRRGVNAIGSHHSVKKKVDNLTSLMREMIMGK
ncbi:hypothetical protein vseg_011704 [Gypsophila vaccaria]